MGRHLGLFRPRPRVAAHATAESAIAAQMVNAETLSRAPPPLSIDLWKKRDVSLARVHDVRKFLLWCSCIFIVVVRAERNPQSACPMSVDEE